MKVAESTLSFLREGMNRIFFAMLPLSLLVWMFVAVSAHSSQSINVEESHESINLLNTVEWTINSDKMQLSDIQGLTNWQKNFKPSQVGANQSLWGKVSLRFPSSNTSPYFFGIGNPLLDQVDIYVLDSKTRLLNTYLMGAERAFSQRFIKHRFFVALIEPGQEQVNVYFRIKHDGPLVFPIFLDKQSSMLLREEILLAVLGFISGGLTILSCYFLITYIFMRSPVRFWFSMLNAGFVLLFLNNSGIIGQVTGITAHTSGVTIVLIAGLLLSASKVTFRMLEKIPAKWRHVFYLLSAILLASLLVTDYQTQILLVLITLFFALSVLSVLAFFYFETDKKISNLLGILGASLVAISCVSQVGSAYFSILLSQTNMLLLYSAAMLGLLVVSIAIEAHEKVITHRQTLQQLNVINDLQRFYKLFRNSAEGLYTSTIDGKLISVNPAMCSLFGYDDEKQMLEAIDNASEFYANPDDRDLLLGEIHQHGKVIGKEIKGICRDGSEFWFSISGQIKVENNERYMFGSIFDITERKKSDMSLKFMATHDSLTGVFNRREFEKKLKVALKNATENGAALTVLYLDLDQFKVVNDTCGHKAGDLLINQLSRKLNKLVSAKGTLARLGGDEFGILLQNDNAQMAYLLANKILNAVAEFRFVWEDHIFTLGISIGQASWSEGVVSPEHLLSMADSACYMAKERGRNQVHTYSEDDEHVQRYESQLSWLSQINQAIDNHQFELYYQHYQSLTQHNTGHHYEILLRLKDAGGKLISPADFLPSAERYNLTAKIDKWVIENFFQWLALHPEHIQHLDQANINLSGHSLADKELKLFVLNAFEKHKIPYKKICFEITESMAILKMEETLEFIHTFQNLGCKFALDDFGSGFSSYNHLKNLPVQQLKIDGSFVKDILIDPIDLAMVKSIKDVAKAMGMETIAEFVESTDIMVELGKMGVDYAQGYGIAKPAPLTNFMPLNH